MTSLHWQTSLQTQKGHALTQSLKGTGYGLDFEVKEMTLLCSLLSAEALHVDLTFYEKLFYSIPHRLSCVGSVVFIRHFGVSSKQYSWEKLGPFEESLQLGVAATECRHRSAGKSLE